MSGCKFAQLTRLKQAIRLKKKKKKVCVCVFGREREHTEQERGERVRQRMNLDGIMMANPTKRKTGLKSQPLNCKIGNLEN